MVHAWTLAPTPARARAWRDHGYTEQAASSAGQARIVPFGSRRIGMRALLAAREQCGVDERGPDMPLPRRIETGGVDRPWVNPAVVRFHFDIVSKPPVNEALSTTRTHVEASHAANPAAFRHDSRRARYRA